MYAAYVRAPQQGDTHTHTQSQSHTYMLHAHTS